MSNQKIIFDENYISSILETEDTSFVIELYDIYLLQAQSILVKIVDPSSDNIDDILYLAHKLKSSSRSVGAVALGNHLEAVEQAARDNDIAALADHILAMNTVVDPTLSMISNRVSTLRGQGAGDQ